jgi:hypothetical protein
MQHIAKKYYNSPSVWQAVSCCQPPMVFWMSRIALMQTRMIGGHDAVEEFLTCTTAGSDFEEVSDSGTVMSKVAVSLPKFLVAPIEGKSGSQFLVKVELDAEQILESYDPREHDAYVSVKLPNGGRLNRVFEQMGVAYVSRPTPAPQLQEREKLTLLGKKCQKKAKVAPKKKADVVKIIWPKVKSGVKGLCEIELALVKPIKWTKKYLFRSRSSRLRLSTMVASIFHPI